MLTIDTGDIICAKSIDHRIVLEMREAKNGRQRPVVNIYGYKFQSDHNLLSTVGVFLYLGKFPEQVDGLVTQKWAEQALRNLGWTMDSPESVGAVGQR